MSDTPSLAALSLCLVFLASAEARNLVLGAVALATGAVIYAFRRNPAPVLPADRTPAG